MTTTPPKASSAAAAVSASSRHATGSDEAHGAGSSDWANADDHGTTPTAATPMTMPSAVAGRPRTLVTLHLDLTSRPESGSTMMVYTSRGTSTSSDLKGFGLRAKPPCGPGSLRLAHASYDVVVARWERFSGRAGKRGER